MRFSTGDVVVIGKKYYFKHENKTWTWHINTNFLGYGDKFPMFYQILIRPLYLFKNMYNDMTIKLTLINLDENFNETYERRLNFEENQHEEIIDECNPEYETNFYYGKNFCANFHRTYDELKSNNYIGQNGLTFDIEIIRSTIFSPYELIVKNIFSKESMQNSVVIVDNKIIKINRELLMSCSKIFHQILKSRETPILINDVNYEVFNQATNILFAGNIACRGTDCDEEKHFLILLNGIYQFAVKYEISILKNFCLHFVNEGINLSEESFVYIHHFAKLNGMCELEKKCEKYLVQNNIF